MDKGRRQELTKLKFKKRLINNTHITKGGYKIFAFKQQSKPCSCLACQPKGKYRDKRQFNNKEIDYLQV